MGAVLLFLAGAVFLALGVATALWWTAKLVLFVAGDDQSFRRNTTAAEVLQQLLRSAEKDLAERRISEAVYRELVAYLRQRAQALQTPLSVENASKVNHYSLAEYAAPAVANSPLPTVAQAPVRAPAPAPVLSPTAPALEKVRTLQSLGIIAVFAFIVFFVRNQMWSDASVVQRLVLLFMATGVLYAVGFTLCRWTNLRLTGIAFSVLAHLSWILNYQVALAVPVSQRWQAPLAVGAALLFTATAAWNARALREPVFQALMLCGALASWGLSALACGVSLQLLAAAYVPAFIVLAIINSRVSLSPAVSLVRWSSAWWQARVWAGGVVLLALALPGMAFVAPREAVAQSFAWHAAAMGGLAAALLVAPGLISGVLSAWLLLVMGPLYAHATTATIPGWVLALLLPGALLAAAGAILADRAGTRRAAFHQLTYFSAGAMAAGLLLLLFARCRGISVAAWWPLLAALAGACCLLGLRRRVFVWVIVLGAALGLVMLADSLYWPDSRWPLLWLLLGLGAAALWRLRAPAGAAPRFAAFDGLTLISGAFLMYFSARALRAGQGQTSDVALGWGLLALQLLLTSVWQERPWWRSLGWLALGLASSVGCLYAGLPIGTLGLSAAGAALLCSGVDRALRQPGFQPLLHSSARLWLAPALIGIYAMVWAIYAAARAQRTSAGIAFVLLALGALLLAQRLADYSRSSRAMVATVIAWVLCAPALYWCFCPVLDDWLALPFQLVLVNATVVLLTMALSWAAVSSGRAVGILRVDWLRGSGQWAALVLSLCYVAVFVHWRVGAEHLGLRLSASWVPALVPLALLLRRGPGPRLGLADEIFWFGGHFLAAGFTAFAVLETLRAGFWQSACPEGLRLACGLFFAAVLLLAVVAGIRLRSWAAPFGGFLALLGLSAVVFGHCALPPQSFILFCGLLSWLGYLMVVSHARAEASGGQAESQFRFAAMLWLSVFNSTLAAVLLLLGLVFWPAGAGHAWAVAGALTLSLWFWRASTAYATTPLWWAKLSVFCACLVLSAAICHVFRCFGPGCEQLGFAIAGAALLLLGVCRAAACIGAGEDIQRQAARRQGLGLAIWTLGVLAFLAAILAKARSETWLCAVTSVEVALLCWSSTFAFRDERSGAWVGEAAGWMLLLFGLGAAVEGYQVRDASIWPLFGALCLLLGIVAEGLAGRLAPTPLSEGSPPFMESRHFAALAVALLGLLWALLQFLSGSETRLESWRTFAGVALLAGYGSAVRWSFDERINSVARAACGYGTYVVLVPLSGWAFVQTQMDWGIARAVLLVTLAVIEIALGCTLHAPRRMVGAGVAVCLAAGLILILQS